MTSVANAPFSHHPGLPRLARRNGSTWLEADGLPFLMLAGETRNSSSSSLEYMKPIWPRLARMNVNTVLPPLSWELIEPEEGRYDFALLEGLVDGAREHNLRLVFLWFGTWKNSKSSYAPAWVRTDTVRFPRALRETGEPTRTISMMSQEAREADARAFAAVMRRIREIDAGRHTVLMMQVENETGLLTSPRDHSPAAEAAFRQPVPAELMQKLIERRGSLQPEFDRLWEATDRRESGSWTEVFAGAADEAFMAWHTCRFVDAVAAAGKAEYPLPMFANAWLINAPTQKPGVYPSGGPVDRMLDIWMAGAPHLDALAPDIYRPDFRAVCQAYVHAGNPLVIPEARRDERCASTALYAIGEHEAVMFAPFGIDSIELPHPLTETYRALGEIAPLLLERRGKKMTAGFYQEKDQEEWTRDLGIFRLRVKTRSPLKEGAAPGGAIVVALEKDEYLIAGQGLNFEFESLDAGRPNAELLWVDEGDFRRGQWIAGRRLNGDENGHGQWINLDNTMQIVKAKIFAY